MKSLQEWYRLINAIYLDRNFYRSTESIFAHLIEVSRGLAVAAMQRRKRNLDPEEFLPKSLAWWLALCGRAGIPNVEQMLWTKFPRVCPYCQHEEHKGQFCKEGNPPKTEIDWKTLKRLGESGTKPRTLAEWQQMFNKIYPRHDDTDHETNVHRLTEEMGELSEAVRTLPVAPQYFIAEAPDVFAWLMGFANQFDFDRRIALHEHGTRLTELMESEYPGHCKLCGRQVCKCPPIPASTLGRIIKDAPADLIPQEGLFSVYESIQLFKKGEEEITVGNQIIALQGEEIRKIREDTEFIMRQLKGVTSLQPAILVSLVQTLAGLHKVAEQGEITQESINELLKAFQSLPPEGRQVTLGFVNNVAASATFNAVMVALQNLIP